MAVIIQFVDERVSVLIMPGGDFSTIVNQKFVTLRVRNKVESVTYCCRECVLFEHLYDTNFDEFAGFSRALKWT